VGCGGMAWIELAQNRRGDRWQVLENAVMNL
jgi:hypothetical protein